VPVEQKMLAHERDLLVLFRASFFCPNVAYCSMSKHLVVLVYSGIFISNTEYRILSRNNLLGAK